MNFASPGVLGGRPLATIRAPRPELASSKREGRLGIDAPEPIRGIFIGVHCRWVAQGGRATTGKHRGREALNAVAATECGGVVFCPGPSGQLEDLLC